MAKKTFNNRQKEDLKQMYIPEYNMYTEAFINESDYMAISNKWKELRMQRMKIDGFRCRDCGTPFNLSVHHIAYPGVWGMEKMDDLVTVCPKCHKKIHEEKKENK